MLAAAGLLPVPAGAQSNGGPGSPAAPADGGVPVDPYVDPSQLAERPSFELQPWRAWMDTVPGTRVRDGIGIQYRVPAGTDHDRVVGVLADAGVARMRVEVPWNAMAPPGDQLGEEGRRRLDTILSAAEGHGVAPLLLLNANAERPGPYEERTVEVAATAPAGAREVRLVSTEGLVAGRSGFTDPAEEVMAGVLFADVDDATGTVRLGRPLPTHLDPGEVVTVHTLAFAPLHPVGTPAFEATAAGWVAYVRAVLDLAGGYDLDGVQVEIWNETAFASDFLDVANYDESFAPEGEAKFRPGGRAWELARRTTDMVSDEFPGVGVVWGFSNTNFYATRVEDLPPGTDAVSYHPYASGLVEVPEDFPERSQLSAYDEVPEHLRLAVPEGRTATAAVPQPLVRRRLAPERRHVRPPGTDEFQHLVTEHGCTPREAGIVDGESAMRHKARCLLRFLPFWLNKGIGQFYVSRAWDADPLGRGLLDPAASPADPGADLGSDAVDALGRFAAVFEDAEDLDVPRQLAVDVTALGEQRRVFGGGRGGDGLWEREQLAVLPFQVTASRFAVATYVLTYDLTTPIEPEPYRLTFTGVRPGEAEVRWYDPLTGTEEDVVDLVKGDGSITVTVAVTDTARLLVIDEDPSEPAVPTRWVVPGAVLLVLAAAAVWWFWSRQREPAPAPSPWPDERRGGGGGGRGRRRGGGGRGGGGRRGRRRGAPF